MACRRRTVADREPAPPNNLPRWEDCALRVSNSDLIAKRVAEGGYGAEPGSLLATELHRFIYEYDDMDPYRSAWFMHRLELVLNEARADALRNAGVAATHAYHATRHPNGYWCPNCIGPASAAGVTPCDHKRELWVGDTRMGPNFWCKKCGSVNLGHGWIASGVPTSPESQEKNHG